MTYGFAVGNNRPGTEQKFENKKLVDALWHLLIRSGPCNLARLAVLTTGNFHPEKERDEPARCAMHCIRYGRLDSRVHSSLYA